MNTTRKRNPGVVSAEWEAARSWWWQWGWIVAYVVFYLVLLIVLVVA